MEIGKLPNNLLREIIINKIKSRREEVLLKPGVGEDCSALDIGDNLCIMSSDPITGAENKIGNLAVNVSCNDLAACGAEPVGLMVTILAPPTAAKESLEEIMEQLCAEANKLNVDIIGGHTEVTDAVSRFVLSTTCIGKVTKGKLISSSGAKPGDVFVLTKHAGMEGTAIIAHDMEHELRSFLDDKSISDARDFMKNISVLKEGLLAANEGASAMHDVTEGGVLGAVWEICEASGVGAEVYKDLIPVSELTHRIAQHFEIDPLKLISSGCMLIAIEQDKVYELIEKLAAEGIDATVIGKITEDRKLYLKTLSTGAVKEIGQPEADEIYKVIKR